MVLDSFLGDTLLAYSWPVTPNEITGRDCAFNQDGSLVAACLNEAVVVLDVRAGRTLFYKEYLDGDPSMIGAIAFVPGQPALLLGGQMPMAYVLDFSTGVLTSSILIEQSVMAIDVLPSGDVAALSLLGTGDPIMAWDLEHNALVDSLSQNCDSYSICLASSKNYFVAGCGGHSIMIWDQKLSRYYGAVEGSYWALSFSVSYLTSLLVTNTYDPNREISDTSTIVLIDLSTRVPVHSWEAHTSAGLLDTAFSNDGTLIATAGYDGVINVWFHQTL
jgi:WD40 repeat protein